MSAAATCTPAGACVPCVHNPSHSFASLCMHAVLFTSRNARQLIDRPGPVCSLRVALPLHPVRLSWQVDHRICHRCLLGQLAHPGVLNRASIQVSCKRVSRSTPSSHTNSSAERRRLARTCGRTVWHSPPRSVRAPLCNELASAGDIHSAAVQPCSHASVRACDVLWPFTSLAQRVRRAAQVANRVNRDASVVRSHR